jgi:pimeloyl-ACP methyl ester carboxylesterase
VQTGRAARWPKVVVGLALIAALAYLVGFFGYGLIAADEYLSGEPRSESCETPGSRFGWAYEAVNYDLADDAALLAANPNRAHCTSQGARAGTEVVAADGVHLAGWYIPRAAGGSGGATASLAGTTGPTVVLVHGGKTNKSGMLDYAAPLHADYNLLVVDLRNSGRSGAARSTGGLLEQGDLRAMLDWLARTKHPSWIAVVGNSNGAGTALAEARTDTTVRALVLDSMHASLEAQLGNVIETEWHLPAWPGAWGVMIGVQLRLGTAVQTVDPITTITQVGDRPVLLTHGELDPIDRPADSLERNVAAAARAGIDTEVHRCPGAGHGEVVIVCATEWASWVLDFLAAHGGVDPGPR